MDILNNNICKSGERAFDLYNVVVRPKLRMGHEGELITWLKETGLLRSGLRCNTPTCNGRWMNWANGRLMDKFKWHCPSCTFKHTIRDGSFFVNIKCELKVVIQAIMGWCKQIPVDLLTQDIGGNVVFKQPVIKRIFDRCSETASCYMMEHWQQWCLGGDGALVLVDVFPGGYIKTPQEHPMSAGSAKKRGWQTILCLADLGTLPPRTWLQIVKSEAQLEKQTNIEDGLVYDALQLIRRHVLPGSALVANYKARCCSMEAVRKLEGFASVTSVEQLIKYDQTGVRLVQDNLETIWQSVSRVCRDVQDVHLSCRAATIALHEYMWRQRFAPTPTTAFENLLHHISEQYQLKD